MHPWYRQPSLKRRLSHDEDEEDKPDRTPARVVPDSPSRPLSKTTHHTKRRRCDTLERGIAQLTLNTTANRAPVAPPPLVLYPTNPSASTGPTTACTQAPAPGLTITPISPPGPFGQPAWNASQTPYGYAYPYTNASQPVVLPGSVEEPTSPLAPPRAAEEEPDVPDVQMRGPSWYEIEKDRIVINDLEDSDSEENEEGSSAEGGMTLSPALLEHLANGNQSALPVFPEPDASKALVLFRPLVIPTDTSEEEKKPEEERDVPDVSPVARTDIMLDDDDAMDVEPMDIEL
ncbi:hypothetical protein SCP_0309710 [Sparassis crispa]|uniref:Uncharacterized protein n=1 Tax=Sparassis crispa TaxID=139825 RepID=A0A401GGD4_9APHY|nr:hypothetical protein SCP_0309710 [Sparassis crispa]GBE81244.1 hypothetical protein SCP_0309710 [Sparassis crispa]